MAPITALEAAAPPDDGGGGGGGGSGAEKLWVVRKAPNHPEATPERPRLRSPLEEAAAADAAGSGKVYFYYFQTTAHAAVFVDK